MKSLIKKVWSFLADFFNPKEWVKLFRSVPAIALTLIVLANVLMNLVAAKSIFNIEANVHTSSSWFTGGEGHDFWIIQDAGILVSWIGFLVGDLLVKAFGSKNAIRINIASLGISLFISFLLIGVANIEKIPGIVANWSVAFDRYGNLLTDAAIRNDSVNGVIGNMWEVILGSAAATFVGILVNNITQGILLKKMIKKHGDHYFGYFVAAGASTVFGQVIDNIVFALLIGMHFFGWSLFSVLMCSLLGAVVEFVAEMLFTPITYKISKNWEKNHIGSQWMDAKSDALTSKAI